MSVVRIIAVLAPIAVFAQTPCERLKSVALVDVVVTSAKRFPKGRM